LKNISVILPVYNSAPHLPQTLDSILAQTLQADQIIVINDGSTDQSLELIYNYQRKEQRIQIIDQPNGGVSKARNRGLEICQGELIALMDSDDICLPTRFEEQSKILKDLKADICGSWVEKFGDKNRISKYPKKSSLIKWNYIFLGRTIANPTCMLRRSIIDSTRYAEDLFFAEDYCFFLELLIKNPEAKITNIQKTLLRYRTHPQQATQRLKSQNIENITNIHKRLLPSHSLLDLEQLIPLHIKIWALDEPLCESELISYLPFMTFLTEWLSREGKSPEPASAFWQRLINKHSSLSLKEQDLIRRSSIPFAATWKSKIENFFNIF
jgi:glycosyltransferase involved in cell wall biosynthesis